MTIDDAAPVPNPSRSARTIPLPGGELFWWERAVAAEVADRWLGALAHGLDWEHEVLTIFGRAVRAPRRVAWYGDPGCRYRYSGRVHEPRPWTPLLAEIRAEVERLSGTTYNSVLANRYDDGGDSMGWHSDDERELGPAPVIASLSLGATRKLRFRHRARRAGPRELWLAHGSLLVMRGPTQRHWQHALPKTRRAVGLRINLTFRTIIPNPASR